MDDLLKRATLWALVMGVWLGLQSQVHARDPLDEIEALFNQEAQRIEKDVAPTPSTRSGQAPPRPTLPDVETLSGLSTLEPFSDVAVIQKKFLPKSGRFELSGSLLSSINNPFFLNLGGTGRFAYYFTEKYAVEFNYFHFGTAATGITKDLRDNLGVETTDFVTSKSFYGADFKWSPIYGKYSFRDRSIIPFDMYFSLGLGITETNQDTNPMTYHFGTGQQLALTRNIALKWDFSWNIYYSKTATSTSESLKDDVVVSLGASFFLPGVSTR